MLFVHVIIDTIRVNSTLFSFGLINILLKLKKTKQKKNITNDDEGQTFETIVSINTIFVYIFIASYHIVYLYMFIHFNREQPH